MTAPTPIRWATLARAPLLLLLLLLCALAKKGVRGASPPSPFSSETAATKKGRPSGSTRGLAFAASPPCLLRVPRAVPLPVGASDAGGTTGRCCRSPSRSPPRASALLLRSEKNDPESDGLLPAGASSHPGFIGSRRQAAHWIASKAVAAASAAAATTMTAGSALAAEAAAREDRIPDRMDVDNFLRTGMVANPMGVSGQAGKSRPETGVLLREGTDVRRDATTGDVLAELLLKSSSSSQAGGGGGEADLTPFVATFQSPWPLATGTVFDVECRDPKTGDGVFLQVTPKLPPSATTASALSDSFLVEQLVSPTGRFSFYGPPTDFRVRGSSTVGGDGTSIYKVMDVSFSLVSQSTQTELPRQARVVATIPSGASQAVLLVASSSSLRWKKVEPQVSQIVRSFKAVAAPPTQLRVRAKERR